MDVWGYGLEKYKLLIFNENEQETPQFVYYFNGSPR